MRKSRRSKDEIATMVTEGGRKGGRARSSAKADAAQENGGRGGRPRLVKVKSPGESVVTPKGSADLKFFWPFVLGKLLEHGGSGVLRMDGEDCVLTVPGAPSPFRLGRMARRVSETMGDYFIGVSRLCRVRREAAGQREEYRATATGQGAGVTALRIERVSSEPVPPPSPTEVMRREMRELTKTRKMVGLMRKLGASDAEIAKGMSLPEGSPAFQ